MATVADVTVAIEDRCAAFLAQARALTGDSVTPGTALAVGWAVRMLGYPTGSLLTATDSEVGAVDSEKLDALLDLAELRTLESIQTNLTAVSVTAGPLREEYGKLGDQLAEIVRERRGVIGNRYGKWLAEPLTDAVRRARLRVL